MAKVVRIQHMRRIFFFLLLTIVMLGACSPKTVHKDSQPEGPAKAVQTQTYAGVGTVKSIDPNMPAIEINHEDIKGLMPAMQMQFHVKEKALIEGLSPEDRITFTIENGIGGMKIVAIHKM